MLPAEGRVDHMMYDEVDAGRAVAVVCAAGGGGVGLGGAVGWAVLLVVGNAWFEIVRRCAGAGGADVMLHGRVGAVGVGEMQIVGWVCCEGCCVCGRRAFGNVGGCGSWWGGGVGKSGAEGGSSHQGAMGEGGVHMM